MNRVRRLLALVLVLATVAIACGGGRDSGGRAANGTSTTRDGSDGGEAGGGNGIDGDDGDDLIDAANGEAQPPGLDLSQPVARTDVPAEGRYEYEYQEVGRAPSTRVYGVADIASDEGWIRQLTSFGSQSSATRALVVWLADRYYQEVEQRAREDQVAAACQWDPGFVILRLPLEVGASWTSESECHTEASDRRRTMDAKVTGTRTVQIGGTSVEVFVIEQTTVTTTDVKALTPVTTEETEATTDLYSADRRMLVESKGTLTATVDGAPRGVPQVFTLTLRSLTPEPAS